MTLKLDDNGRLAYRDLTEAKHAFLAHIAVCPDCRDPLSPCPIGDALQTCVAMLEPTAFIGTVDELFAYLEREREHDLGGEG